MGHAALDRARPGARWTACSGAWRRKALAARPLCELSGGEVQRLLLAQALLGRPKLLLLDEPFLSLDPHFQQATVELVKRIQRDLGITVLFTAHELNPLLEAMDRVLYLGQGRAALGTRRGGDHERGAIPSLRCAHRCA